MLMQPRNTVPVLLMLNAGSSSLKYAVFTRDSLQETHRDSVERLEGDPSTALPGILAGLKERDYRIDAVGHRLVHGGPDFTDHVAIDGDVLDRLRGLGDLAPNHVKPECDLVAATFEQLPGIPQYACFDTVFHKDMPDRAKTLPVAASLREKGVRRYGFHGLSYTYIMSCLSEFVGRKAQGRVVLAHLGSGCSLAAVKKGVGIDTTMGLTPFGGVMMGTRPGDLDPGILGYLVRAHGLGIDEFESLCMNESGLKGVSGLSGDVRDLFKAEAANTDAALALSMFCLSLRKGIAAMAAALDGIDLLVFTGGIGAHSADIRQRVIDDLDWLGLTLDPAANKAGERCISAPASKVMALAMETDEERAMAEAVAKCLV